MLHLDHCNLAISGTLNAEGSLWLQGATLGTHGIAPLELRGGATIEDESEWFHSGSSITVIDGRALIDASSVLHIAPGCNLRVGPPTRTNIPSLAVHGRLEAEGTGLITIAVSSALTVIGRLEAPERSIQVGSHPVSDQERTATFDVSGSAWVNDLRLSEFSEPTLGVAHARVRVTGGSLQVDDTVAVDTVGAEMTISDSGSVMVGNIEPLPDTLAIASSVTGDLQLHANLFVGPGATIEFGKIANLGSNDFPVHYVGGTITAVPGSLVAIWPGNKLQASGAAEVNGTLDLSRGEWRQPTQSTRWRALRAVPLVGEPDVISPDIPGLVPKYYRREATLMVAFNPALEGDVNSDGVVDTDDLARLLNGFGLFDKVWCDFDADDFIDLDDLMIILFNFGQTAEP
ncbi:MAG: hypothetical protein KDA20_07985 [Phycisphaerales bacterium]|nr:hypothetical protein [Phycisphaerales bacterium]